MGLLQYLSYGAILAAFAFVTLSLASGLLYVSELIEEHSQLAKKIGQRGIYVVIGLHVVLCISESLPIRETLFSIVCHIVYLQNFSASWPLISLSSVTFILSCIMVIGDHFLWFNYFSSKSHNARHQNLYRGSPEVHVPGFPEIATFFGICVWLAPLFLFLSLSANDNALPLAEPSTPSSAVPPPPSRMSLMRYLLSPLDWLMPKLGGRGGVQHGIIASQHPQQSHLQPHSFSSRQFTPRPSSPLSRSFIPDDGVQLAPPPKRTASTLSLRRQGEDR